MSVVRRLRRTVLGGAGASSREARVRTPAGAREEGLQEPPPCPPGWRTGPPDFVGIGAQKAGTTWWFSLVYEHPRVHHPESLRREIHFFDRNARAWVGDADVERYHRYFPRTDGLVVGEKSPEYMAEYWVAPQLKRAAPEARLIALLRDPVERYRSGLTHGEIYGWRVDRQLASDAFHRGKYGEQLRWLFRWFDPGQVLVLQYEACVEDPARELARTYAFLGLPAHTLPDEILGRYRNRTRVEKVTLEPERAAVLPQLYEPDVELLAGLVPGLDLALWPSFAHLAR